MALCIDALPSSVTDMAIPSFKDSTNMTTQNAPLNTTFTLQMGTGQNVLFGYC